MENVEEMQTLIKAARSGSVQSVKQALEFGDDVNTLSSDHWTALMAASEEGHTDVVELLLANKANVDMQRPNGDTALDIACEHGQVGSVRALLASGAAIELANDRGYTALMIASLYGHTDVVELLVENAQQAALDSIMCFLSQQTDDMTEEKPTVENAQQAALDSITCFLSQQTDDMTEEKPTEPNRWDATWGEAATRDRVGDHTAARYRHFRRYIDEHDEAVDASLFAELVSVEELRRELQPYEDAGGFLRLALTGDLVEKLQ
ncbi:hypothetical protein BBJ28_00025017, partial [Nothophytophthora sp. Chile5]